MPRTTKKNEQAARAQVLATARTAAAQSLVSAHGTWWQSLVTIVVTGMCDGTVTWETTTTGKVRVTGAADLVAKATREAVAAGTNEQAATEAFGKVSASAVSNVAQGLVMFYMQDVKAAATAEQVDGLVTAATGKWSSTYAVQKSLGYAPPTRTTTTAPTTTTSGKGGKAAPTTTAPTAPPTVDSIAAAVVAACKAHKLDMTAVLKATAAAGRAAKLTTVQVVTLD
jgi:hypothetical protein